MALEANKQHRNIGPTWGYRAVIFWSKILPLPIAKIVMMVSAFITMILLPKQSRYSKEYLNQVNIKPVIWSHVWRHYYSFIKYLVARFRSTGDSSTKLHWITEKGNLVEKHLLKGTPLLLGTFHVGHSDLMGFNIKIPHRKINMVRLKMENSAELQNIIETSVDSVSIIWVNDRNDLIIKLKDALLNQETIAMQCDRIEHSSKVESFQFLGEKREFPFTIYHLSIIFSRPVAFCIGIPIGDKSVKVLTTNLYYPDAETRTENLLAGKKHFQSVLSLLENILKENPYLWYNFIPLNPVSKDK